MKNSIVVLGLVFALFSCEREIDCGNDEISHCRINNNTEEIFVFKVDDKYHSEILRWDTINFYLPVGMYNFKLIQKTGYDSIPYVKEYPYYEVDRCIYHTWSVKWDELGD